MSTGVSPNFRYDLPIDPECVFAPPTAIANSRGEALTSARRPEFGLNSRIVIWNTARDSHVQRCGQTSEEAKNSPATETEYPVPFVLRSDGLLDSNKHIHLAASFMNSVMIAFGSCVSTN